MGSSRTLLKDIKVEPDMSSVVQETSDASNNFAKLCTRNILSAIGSRFFSKSQESTNVKKQEPTAQVPSDKELKKEEKVGEKTPPAEKEIKKIIGKTKPDDRNSLKMLAQSKRNDRDYQRYRTKYNTSLGSIMSNWMNLIYCILILRLNLIKFILKNLPSKDDFTLRDQIIGENKIMYEMIKSAQSYSQEQSLALWKQLEKLIYNQLFLRSSLELQQRKDPMLHDWKAAIEKLALAEAELEKTQSWFQNFQKKKMASEAEVKEKLTELEDLTNKKNAEMDELIEQITECKKKEVTTRGRILLNMKSYKDMKTKRQYLIGVEKQMNELKEMHNIMVKDYTAKIQSLKNQIEEKENLIKAEVEERKKIKASLQGFGDVARKKSEEALNAS